jgi:iron(II)-dependent oxidoreductase
MSVATTSTADVREAIRAQLEASRRRTLALVDCLDPDDQTAQHSPLMSPIVWDLAHIGNYEELWLLRALDGRPPVDATLDDLYNAFEHPRWERPSLPILGPDDARRYVAGVRTQVFDLLETIHLDDDVPLLAGGFVYGMVAQHEQQHDETMVATHQLRLERAEPLPGTTPAPTTRQAAAGEVHLPGGDFTLGTDDDAWAYDNERPAHPVEVAPFVLDTGLVTNAEFHRFIAAGGYDEPRLWTGTGWAWRTSERLAHPLFWRDEGGGDWSLIRFGRRIDVPPDEPVQHVCWYEADAYARWAGKRLPTEPEWEFAATAHPDGRKRRHPWGDAAGGTATANLGQRHDGPSAAGQHPEGDNPWGVGQLIGDVWEWTSSDFAPYPNFRSFPYAEYSDVFFGSDYKVLRGGSWATDAVAVRGTFRNWDLPIRRQIFAGFRCARDA